MSGSSRRIFPKFLLPSEYSDHRNPYFYFQFSCLFCCDIDDCTVGKCSVRHHDFVSSMLRSGVAHFNPCHGSLITPLPLNNMMIPNHKRFKNQKKNSSRQIGKFPEEQDLWPHLLYPGELFHRRFRYSQADCDIKNQHGIQNRFTCRTGKLYHALVQPRTFHGAFHQFYRLKRMSFLPTKNTIIASTTFRPNSQLQESDRLYILSNLKSPLCYLILRQVPFPPVPDLPFNRFIYCFHIHYFLTPFRVLSYTFIIP